MQYLKDAAAAVAAERDRIQIECAALREFEAEIAGMEPASRAAATASGQAGVVAVESRTDGALRTIRRQYRETIIAAREETAPAIADRSLADQLAADFGRETALAVTSGGSFTPHLKQSLLHACRRARSTRSGYARTLDAESDAVETLRALATEIDEIIGEMDSVPMLEHSFDDLFDIYVQLTEIEDRLDTFLEARQATLRQPANGASVNELVDVRNHLYQSVDTAHPILADGVALARSVRTARGQVSRALARRV